MTEIDDAAEQLAKVNDALRKARAREQELKGKLSVLQNEIAVHESDRVIALKALRLRDPS